MSPVRHASTHWLMCGRGLGGCYAGWRSERARAFGQLPLDMPGRVPHLADEGGNDLAISFPEAVICGRSIALHLLMERRKSVIGHHREHVMLDVVIHVPIDEAEDRVHV